VPDDRLFHKALGHSAKVNSLTDIEEIVWRTYINGGSDDFGVMRFDAAPLQNAHDRLLARPTRQVMRWLERVAAVGLVHTFPHQGRTYCFQLDWQDWQHLRYPQRTVHPLPPADELARCSVHTRWLFRHHPGGVKLSSWRDPDSGKPSGNPSGNFPGIFPESSRTDSGTDSGNDSGTQSASRARPLAVSLLPLAVSREPGPAMRVSRLAYGGRILEVPKFLDEEFVKRLNGQAWDLTGFYVALEERLTQTGEPWDLRWIRERFAEASPPPARAELPFTREERTTAERLHGELAELKQAERDGQAFEDQVRAADGYWRPPQ